MKYITLILSLFIFSCSKTTKIDKPNKIAINADMGFLLSTTHNCLINTRHVFKDTLEFIKINENVSVADNTDLEISYYRDDKFNYIFAVVQHSQIEFYHFDYNIFMNSDSSKVSYRKKLFSQFKNIEFCDYETQLKIIKNGKL